MAKCLALRVLRRLARALEAVLLPLLHPRIAGQETGLSKREAMLRVQLEAAGVLVPLTESRWNRSWEAAGLLDLIEGLESGSMPA